MTEPIDIHWRRNSPPREPFAHFSLSSLLLWVGFAAALLAIYRALGFGFGFFPLIAVSWLFIAWRGNARGTRLWLVPGLCAFPGLFLYSMQFAHPFAYQQQCQNNLKNIGMAIANSTSARSKPSPIHTFDADGRPLHSWRTLLLPQLDRNGVYKQVDREKPWNDPVNLALQDAMHSSVYRCPEESDEVDKRWTNYLAVVHSKNGQSDKYLRWEDLPNGTSNTAMLAEVSNSGIHWMEPRDLHVTQMAPYLNGPPGQGPSSRHGRGVNVLFTDGRVQTISNDTDPAVVRRMLTGDVRQSKSDGELQQSKNAR